MTKDDIRAGCTLHRPYPEIKVEKKDPVFASLLSVPYAGTGGEIYSTLSYLYGSNVLFEKSPVVSEALKCVAKTEMYHTDILAKLIVLLGGDPKYTVAQGRRPFTTAGMHYGESENAILRGAISGEEGAIYVYEKLAESTDDENIKAILSRIIEDEKHHACIFRELLRE